MTVHQLTAEVAAFTGWLRELAARLDPGAGWYGVFAARDPEGLRACLDGVDILPWDVAASFLQDLGEPLDGAPAVRGRALHAAAAAAHDRGSPGAAEDLARRRDLMRHEARAAESRLRDLAADGADLAWVRDDLTRARARIAELTTRLDQLGRLGRLATPAPPSPLPPSPPAPPAEPSATSLAAPAQPAAGTRRRPRGARYAYLDQAAPPPVVEPPAGPAGPVAAPRGARFGGGPAEAGPVAAPVVDDPQAVRAAGNAVYALRRLRAQGRTGEAHALLCEALAGPAAWLPALAGELHRAGLGADWATVLWEAAALPPGRFAGVAGALAGAGREQDRDQLLRQGAARPVAEVAEIRAALRAAARHPEADALLAAFTRTRTPEDAARLAAVDPGALTRELLAAARTLAPARERDLLHALRIAGLVWRSGRPDAGIGALSRTDRSWRLGCLPTCRYVSDVDQSGMKHDRLRCFAAVVLLRGVTGLTFSSYASRLRA
ncbi:UL36 very large tegument protein [Streptomyces sp. NPDC053493]|uniref:UL36 very large tegument protein n=1 Tax=Streptomyces sp. NPDC053493 TaxID=3365705 RepID=UPI0037CD99A6